MRPQLRFENTGKFVDNIEGAKSRKQTLETMGAFRTLLRPTAFKRRAGVPNWSSEVHTVAQVTPTQVTDQKGNTHDTRLVLPVPARSSTILPAPPPARQDNRRMATQRYAPDLTQIVLRAGSSGATLSAAAKAMAAKQGFTQALRDQRMTFRQFVGAHPQFRVETRGAANRLFVTAERRKTPADAADATLMRFTAP